MTTAPTAENQTTDMQKLAERVRASALELNLNATSLGRKLGLSSSTAANYWNGVRPWPTEVLVRLADLLGADLRWLLCGEALPSGTPPKCFLRMFGDLSVRDRNAVLALVIALCAEEEAR